MMKLKTFAGTVQISGVAVPVAYEPTKLTLDLAGLVLAVPEDERAGVAMRLLDALTSGVPMVVPVSASVAVPAVLEAAPKTAVETAPVAAPPVAEPAPAAKPKTGRGPRAVAKAPLHAAPAVEAPKVAEPAPAPAPAAKGNGRGTIAAPLDVAPVAEDGDDMDDDVAADAAPVVEDVVEEMAAEEPVAEDIVEAREAELPEAIRAAVRVRDVITYLVDQGFTTKERVIAECERLKDSVTVLGRMGGELAMRVERAAAVLGIE